MTFTLVGVHVHAQPARLRETLTALAAHTPEEHAVLLLPDGPDAETRAVLDELGDVPRLDGDRPLGPPACFNRLVSADDAAVYVLLESGSTVGPEWLGRLLAALAADPRHGLAGPSTNRAWNEQAAFPRGGGSPEQIAATGSPAGERGGYEPHCRGETCEHFAPPELIQIYQPLPERPAPEAGGCADPVATASGPPLVSCIMPTADRPRLAARAAEYFLRQDYPEKELIVVDDGTRPVAGLLPDDPRIRYVRLAGRERLGTKRNRACELARGEIVVHWDDDDWAAPHRLTYQVESLLAAGAQVNGLDRLICFDPATRKAWTYTYPRTARPWVAGTSLCYRRDLWRRNPFEAIDVGEDNRFVYGADAGTVQRLADPSFVLALIHRHNTSPKRTVPPRWQPFDPREVVALLGGDAGFYYTPDR